MPNTTSHLRAVTSHDDDYADLDSNYPGKFLECRSLQHRWKLIGFFHQGGEVVRALVCERCDMDRHDYWSRGGARLRSNYHQPDGYRIGNGGASQWEVRQEVLNRVTVYGSEDQMHASLMAGKGRKAAKKAAG